MAKLTGALETWNEWIKGLSTEERKQIDLSKCRLNGCALPGIDLRHVNLSQAALTGCNLEGAKLDCANLSRAFLNKAELGKGTSLLNANLAGAILSQADLSDADLSCCDLTNKAFLGEANLSNTKLESARFNNSNLSHANLSGSSLFHAVFRNANLENVNLTDANLSEADLRDTTLKATDLTLAKPGLLPGQLAGADLTGATLPKSLQAFYEKLGSVSKISDNAKKIFLSLMAGCLYSWLTIATTKDVDLITNRASSPLPIIQTPIPIAGFYIVAPLILLCIYFYLHFYLQKLWDELALLPAIFTDGRPLHQRADPWLFNDLVRSHFPKLRENRPFLSHFQAWISVFLAWGIAPITLLLFWAKYLRRHEPYGTSLHAVLFVLSVVFAVRLFRLAGRTLKGIKRTHFNWKQVIRRKYMYAGLLWALIPTTLLILVSHAAIRGTPQDLIPKTLERLHITPFANLTNADASSRPPYWQEDRDNQLNDVTGAELADVDLNYASAPRGFFPKAQLQGSHLRGAYLLSADLTRANLGQADLAAAHLNGANLKGANLDGADIDCADFRNARGLTKDIIIYSRNWQNALFSSEILRELGLPPDHNETLLKANRPCFGPHLMLLRPSLKPVPTP